MKFLMVDNPCYPCIKLQLLITSKVIFPSFLPLILNLSPQILQHGLSTLQMRL